MIKVENVTKVFHTDEVETYALNGVSMEIGRGEFVAVMGPSGCGKSTLLNILGLLDNPTSGRYWLDGAEVGGLKERARTCFRRGRIGFVFQGFNLIDDLNVEENVALPLKALGVPARERQERVVEVLRRLRMSHRAHHYPQQLSGGQQQRVAIARALIYRPALLLADEPTGNLDQKNSREIMDMLKLSNRSLEQTILLITHDEKVALEAERIITVQDGRILSDERREVKALA